MMFVPSFWILGAVVVFTRFANGRIARVKKVSATRNAVLKYDATIFYSTALTVIC
jgi:hypothetical protein